MEWNRIFIMITPILLFNLLPHININNTQGKLVNQIYKPPQWLHNSEDRQVTDHCIGFRSSRDTSAYAYSSIRYQDTNTTLQKEAKYLKLINFSNNSMSKRQAQLPAQLDTDSLNLYTSLSSYTQVTHTLLHSYCIVYSFII